MRPEFEKGKEDNHDTGLKTIKNKYLASITTYWFIRSGFIIADKNKVQGPNARTRTTNMDKNNLHLYKV